MRPPLVPLALCALLVPASLARHGGTYRGPGGGLGPGPGGGPTTGGPGAGAAGSSDWSAWWSYNRDPYLALKDAVQRAGGPATPGEDFYLGLGQSAGASAAGRPAPDALRSTAVPALLAALEGEDDVDLVTAALVALAKIGLEAADPELPRAEAAIAARLSDRGLEVQETAALALGILGRDAAVPRLAALFGDALDARRATDRPHVPERTRALAAYGLGLVAHRSAREDVRRFVVLRLTTALEADDAPGPDLATACLLSLGLVRLPSEPSGTEEEREPAAASPTRSREGQLAWLLAWLRAGKASDAVLAHAPVALARLAQGAAPEAVAEVTDTLLDLVRPSTPAGRDLQRGATIALGLVGDADTDPRDAALRTTLLRLCADRDAFVRGYARLSLARVVSRPGAGEDSERGAREALTWLLRDLGRGSAAARPWTALALGLFEHRRRVAGGEGLADVRAALRARLEDPSGPDEAGALCIALGLAADLQAAPLVRAWLAGGGDAPRAHAAVALGLMGDREAIPALRELARSAVARPALLREVAIALGLLGDRELLPELLDALAKAKTLAAQSALAVAVGTVGDARAVAPLAALVADEGADAKRRAFAAVALGIVADKERLPFNSKLAVDVYYGLPASTLTDPLSGRGVLDVL